MLIHIGGFLGGGFSGVPPAPPPYNGDILCVNIVSLCVNIYYVNTFAEVDFFSYLCSRKMRIVLIYKLKTERYD